MKNRAKQELNKINQEANRFSIRKLTVGVASVLIGLTLMGQGQNAKADTEVHKNNQDLEPEAQKESDQKAATNQVKKVVVNKQANDTEQNVQKQKTELTKAAQDAIQTSGLKGKLTVNKDDLKAKAKTTQDPASLSSSKIAKTNPVKEANSNYNINDWNYTENPEKTNITLTGLKDNSGIKNETIYIPNTYDFQQKEELKDIQKVYIDRKLIGTLCQLGATSLEIDQTHDSKVYAQGDMSATFGINVDNGWKRNTWKKLDLTNLDTSEVTNMAHFFSDQNQLTEVGDLSNWDTGKVTDMSFMFTGDSKLTALPGIDKWDTSKVTALGQIFNGCNSLTQLGSNDNTLTWDTSSVTAMDNMFNSCSSLTKIGFGDKWDTSKVSMLWEFMNGCSKLKEIDGMSNWDVSNFKDMRHFFNGDSKLETIEGGLAGWKLDSMTSYAGLFGGLSSLKELDLSKWDTSKVTDMGSMFNGDSNLTTIGDVSKWDTSKVKSFANMFQSDHALTALPGISNWNTDSLTNMAQMFFDCPALTKLNLDSKDGHWNVSNVTSMYDLFYGDHALSDLSLKNWDVRKAGNSMNVPFGECNSLTNMDLRSWKNAGITNMANWFANMGKLQSINLTGWDTSSVINMSGLFNNDPKLETITGISDWNVSNVTNMSNMFAAIINHTIDNNEPLPFSPNGSLKQLDLSNWKTDNVTDMSGMFEGQQHLTSVGNISNWKTGKVTNLSRMFAQCNNLKWDSNLDLSTWNTSKVTDMSYLFDENNQAKDLRFVDGWDTSKVKNMSYMFAKDPILKKIGNLSKWDVSQVGTATGQNYGFGLMFAGDSSLSDLSGLTNWDTRNLTKARAMFEGTTALKNIDLSGWNTSKLTIAGEMFKDAGATDINLDGWNLSKLAIYNDYGMHDLLHGNQYRGVCYMFTNLQSPAVIHMENIKLPDNTNQFDIKDFVGTQPIVVLMSGKGTDVIRNKLNAEKWQFANNNSASQNPALMMLAVQTPSEITGRQNSDYLTLYDKAHPDTVLATIPMNFVFSSEQAFKDYLKQQTTKAAVLAKLDDDHKNSWIWGKDIDPDTGSLKIAPNTSLIDLITGKYGLTFGHAKKHTTKDVIRTINVINPDGKKVTTTQTVTLNGTLTGYDQKTGDPNYSWSTGTWAEFRTPTITGYTPTIAAVEAKDVNDPKAADTVNIGYTPVETTKEVTRTIIVTNPDGKKVTTKQTVTLTGIPKYDSETEKGSYSWSKGTWEKFTTPPITGYTPNIAVVDAVTVNSDTQNTTINISYNKNHDDMPVVPDVPVTPTTPTQPTKPVQPTKPKKKPTKPVKPNTNKGSKPHKTSHKSHKGYNYNTRPHNEYSNGYNINARVNGENGFGSNGNTKSNVFTNVKSQSMMENNALLRSESREGKNKLPNTGNKQSTVATIFGLLALSLSGILSLSLDRKKKRK